MKGLHQVVFAGSRLAAPRYTVRVNFAGRSLSCSYKEVYLRSNPRSGALKVRLGLLREYACLVTAVGLKTSPRNFNLSKFKQLSHFTNRKEIFNTAQLKSLLVIHVQYNHDFSKKNSTEYGAINCRFSQRQNVMLQDDPASRI